MERKSVRCLRQRLAVLCPQLGVSLLGYQELLGVWLGFVFGPDVELERCGPALAEPEAFAKLLNLLWPQCASLTVSTCVRVPSWQQR
jgi:hypothetical protein